MNVKDKAIGFAITGSFCTIEAVVPQVQALVLAGAIVLPIVSPAVQGTDTRFGQADELIEKLQAITGHQVLTTIKEAEPIGPKGLLDVMVVAPCTGNTLSKIANAVTDTVVTMAVKAHLRNNSPVVLAVSTNDGLGANAKNIGLLLNQKNMFFVPFFQDDPQDKANSLVAAFDLVLPTVETALEGKQLQPLLYLKSKTE